VFGVKLAEVEASAGEKRWFIGFTIASFFYRIFIMLAIALFIATHYMIVGVVLAIWAVGMTILYPAVRGIGYLLFHARLRRQRVRALAITAAVAAIAGALLFVAPTPYWTRADGVIWVPADAQLRAGADGFVRSVAARPGTIVRRGTPLLVAENPELGPKIRVLEAQVQLLETRAQAEQQTDRVRWEITRDALKATREELAHYRRLERELTVYAPTSGSFVLTVAAVDLPGRFLRKGQEIGYVVPAATATARVLVSQDDIDIVRTRTEQVRVKLAGRMYDTFTATIRREVPAASDRISNLAMSSVGGGMAALDPSDSARPKTLNTWFEFELELPATRSFVLGEHVYARFEHDPEPVAWRIYRSVRQLFLERFSV